MSFLIYKQCIRRNIFELKDSQDIKSQLMKDSKDILTYRNFSEEIFELKDSQLMSY